MASSVESNPNPITHKFLNPNANPFVKPDIMQLKLVKSFFPHTIFEAQHTPPPSMLGHVVFFYQQPTSNWVYPVDRPVYYDAYKQPTVAMGVPFYSEHMGSRSAVASVDIEEKRDAALDAGEREKRVINSRFSKRQPPSIKCLRREKSVAFGNRFWALKNCRFGDQNTIACHLQKKDQDKVVSTLACNGDDEINLEGKTSLMIRNIPNQFERRYLLSILDQHCLDENRKAQLRSDPSKSAYDFVYLPMDFRNRANYGYAFVNFTNAAGASRFQKAFDKFKWDVPVNKKTCKICFAKIQGKEALKNHFKNSVFPCYTSGYLPVVLSPPRDGEIQSKPLVIGRWMERNRDSRNSCQSSSHFLKN